MKEIKSSQKNELGLGHQQIQKKDLKLLKNGEKKIEKSTMLLTALGTLKTNQEGSISGQKASSATAKDPKLGHRGRKTSY